MAIARLGVYLDQCIIQIIFVIVCKTKNNVLNNMLVFNVKSLQPLFIHLVNSLYLTYLRIRSIEDTKFIFVDYATTLHAKDENAFILEESKVCSARRK